MTTDGVSSTSGLPCCDVVMKGGITSGVVYPKALVAISGHYQLRGVGGAYAGAIGAALGAAAELGRGSGGGFGELGRLPEELAGGKLADLFQPQRSTRQLLKLMLTATGKSQPNVQQAENELASPPGWIAKLATHGPGRIKVTRAGARPIDVSRAGPGVIKAISAAARVIKTLFCSFWCASLLGLIWGAGVTAYGAFILGAPGVMLIIAGVLLAIVGWMAAVALRLKSKLTVDLPDNLFGICRGLGTGQIQPGLTDWLAAKIDDIAGLDADARPLRFGHLWTKNRTWASSQSAPIDPAADRKIDLRMISTCLSQGRPYEMPWHARTFFYDPKTWATLFPDNVMKALWDAPEPPPPPEYDEEWWLLEGKAAARHSLRWLPAPEDLPVIVAARLSLSFPLLISAVPLHTIDYASPQTKDAVKKYEEAVEEYQRAVKEDHDTAEAGLKPDFDPPFAKLWFTDGGLCSNFPVHLFDAALPTWPTFAINLGQFPAGQQPCEEQAKNIQYAKNNRILYPPTTAIPERGIGAVTGFAGAAFNTARNWSDNSLLDFPGFRDRIVQVFLTKYEGV